MTEALTPKEAWEVDLPILNLSKRVRRIREFAGDMRPAYTVIGGICLFNGDNPITRRGLVARAERHIQGEPLWHAFENLTEGIRLRQLGSVVVDARHRFGGSQ